MRTYPTVPTFAQLGLLDNLIKALPDTFPGPTPLQALAVPTLLQGRDLIALAPDGAGKTVAWSISVLHKMARPPVSAEPNAPRALVLVHSPARAESVAVDISHLGRYVPVRHTAAEDGSSWNRTVSALKGGIEILVATPRQFVDLWKQRELKLHGVEIVVIDDAEQLLDGMHQDSLDQLLPELPVGRQTAMFTSSSAPELRSIAVLWLTKPVAIKPPPVATQLKGLEGPIHLPEWLNDVPEVVLPDWLSDPDEEAPVAAKPRRVAKGGVAKGVGGKSEPKAPTRKPPAAGPTAPRAPASKQPTAGPAPKPTPKPQLPPRPPASPSKRPAAGPQAGAGKKPPRPGPGKRG